MDTQLLYIAELVETGQRDEAYEALVTLLDADDRNFDAWYAMVQLAKDDAERRNAIYKMWGLRPDDPEANLLLDKLKVGTLPSLDTPHFDFSSRKISPLKKNDDIRDYTIYAVMIALGYVFFYVVGLVVNIYFLYEAHSNKNSGFPTKNDGCLWMTLVAGVGIPSIVIALIIVLFSTGA